eukprot:35166-Rhodomonas_salina.3
MPFRVLYFGVYGRAVQSLVLNSWMAGSTLALDWVYTSGMPPFMPAMLICSGGQCHQIRV